MRGAVACFIFKVFQNLYPEIGSGTTLFVHHYNTINTNNMIKNDMITMSDTLKDYRFPSIDLLKDHKSEHSGLSVRELDKNINRLQVRTFRLQDRSSRCQSLCGACGYIISGNRGTGSEDF